MLNSRSAGLGLLAAVLVGLPAAAQQSAAPAVPTPEVGQMAPDFSIPGATRFGVLKNSVKLSDLRGQTVVIAFFIRARTRG
jgi:peroxiredoxin Q/BCP